MVLWITGNSGSGKTTLARKLHKNQVWLDGDAMRGIWTDLGYSKKDRWEQNMRVAKLAQILDLQGFDVLVSTICPYRKLREEVQKMTKCHFIYLKGGESKITYPYEN